MNRSFEYRQGRISYLKEGAGPALVLLHGFGEDSSVFDLLVPALIKDYTIIIPDLPGSGSSDLIKTEQVSMDDYAEAVFALLQHEQITSCVMLGHSMGGYITLVFAHKYQSMLKGFGFLHSTAFADSEEKKETRRKGIEMIKQYGAFSFLKNTIPNLFSNRFKKDHLEQVTSFIEKAKAFSAEALIQYYTAMINRPDRTQVLKNSPVPVLFVIGTEDAAAPLNDLLQQVHLPATSQINILQGVAHMGMLETPEKVIQFILQFLTLITS